MNLFKNQILPMALAGWLVHSTKAWPPVASTSMVSSANCSLNTRLVSRASHWILIALTVTPPLKLFHLIRQQWQAGKFGCCC